MKFRNITTLFLAFTLVATASFGVATPASADCSYNGYVNSGGKCSKSIKSYDFYDRYEDDDDDDDYQYNYNYRYQNQNFGYYDSDQAVLALIARLQAMIELLESQLKDRDARSDVAVTTRTATNIDENEATLRGRLYLYNEDEAEVYFEYGESRSDLDEETSHQTLDDNDGVYFDRDIDDLDDNTTYYFRAVAEDEQGDEAYGRILSFRTDRTNDDNELPDLDTRDADNITDDEAELNGRVEMNDFNNGRVFFVYGEDESQIEDVPDDYDTYSEIDEDGDNLQKVSVDSDLDGFGTYQEDVSGLDPDTDIYYSICVEFEDEDDDDRIMCGDVETFETDNN